MAKLTSAMLAARNAYAYPPVGLVQRSRTGAGWQARYEPQDFKDSLRLDRHHTTCLNSKNDEEVLSGIFSVMYWGNITARKKCVTRCDWLERGNKASSQYCLAKIGMPAAAAIVRRSGHLLKDGRYEEALTEIQQLPFVGPSFGSKYLAFLDPQNVGVLDDKIVRHLLKGTFDALLGARAVELKSEKTRGKRFARFCALLCDLRDQLNRTDQRWKDTSGASGRFRAIDVERALFALAKQTDLKRPPSGRA